VAHLTGPRFTDRRRFLRLMGFTGAWAAAGTPAFAWAQAAGKGTKPPARGKAPPAPVPAAPPTAGTPPPITAEARAIAKALRERYPDGIAEADLETITRDIDGDLRASRRLRERKLTNDVEPDVTFRA
jgi:hypothetical protein